MSWRPWAPGGILGEMALIDGSPRSVTMRAKTDCVVAPINEKSFLFLVHETPFFAVAVCARSLTGCGAWIRPSRRSPAPAFRGLTIFCLLFVAGPGHDRRQLEPLNLPNSRLVLAR